ncbi:MAG: PEP-CTERM sorting domain-containing protein [Phycisphaerae bacterium]|nr:PEP-CTERM sorting domain-containing protein [Phycisphaerae bacterium]
MRKVISVLSFVLICAASTEAGPLAGDGNAMASWQGTLDVTYDEGGDVLHALLDYAVFLPTMYPGDVADMDSQYVYAYQLFIENDTTVALTFFSIGLDSSASAFNIGEDVSVGQPGELSGVSPALVSIGSSSAQWLFGWGTGAEIDPGEHSTVLVFTSPYGPLWDTTTMANGGFPTPVGLLPSPVPEPATLSLLALGGLALMRRRLK